jgi:two-component system sensor histidine kinase PrrB
MTWPRSLRTQNTLGAALLAIVVVAASGLVIAARIDHQDRAQVDRQLRERAAKVQTDAGKANAPGSILSEDDKPGGARNDTNLLAGTDTLTRILDPADRVVAQRGDAIRSSEPVAAHSGLSTVTIDGHEWRSLVQPTSIVDNGRLQVLQSLTPVQQRLRETTRLIALVALAASLASALLAWLAAGLLLRPLERLRHGASRLRPGDSGDQRLPEPGGQQEVAELTATLNAMLERLQLSLHATRRFTADAGHELRSPLASLGMDLETLRRNPDLPAPQRAEMLDAMTHEHARLAALLEGLQHLARGDAEALPHRTVVDLAELAASATHAAQRRHPTVRYSVASAPPALIDGWTDGIRLALDNLLDNAALHGSPDGRVDVRVRTSDDGSAVCLIVDDDGPGIPPVARARVTERFARGDHPRSGGSGLGLALVEQQARLHDGELTLQDAPAGGLRARLSLPTTGTVRE